MASRHLMMVLTFGGALGIPYFVAEHQNTLTELTARWAPLSRTVEPLAPIVTQPASQEREESAEESTNESVAATLAPPIFDESGESFTDQSDDDAGQERTLCDYKVQQQSSNAIGTAKANQYAAPDALKQQAADFSDKAGELGQQAKETLNKEASALPTPSLPSNEGNSNAAPPAQPARRAPLPVNPISTNQLRVPGDAPPQTAAVGEAGGAASPIGINENPAAQGPPTDLREIFNLEVNSGWILSHWPRVTTGLPQLELQGYRAPLMTGTTERDLAGSITYYFDRQQVLERIIFHGTTGDPRPLITLMTGTHGFERDFTNDPSTFIYRTKRAGHPYSELRIRPAKVVRAEAPNARYEIDLALRRP